MEKQNSLDFYAIRNRLKNLKEESGMSDYEFCEIYAPEKCDAQKKSRAENYISAVFSGRDYPSSPIFPDLVHLQNIVDSSKFPNITLQYLIWGDETPSKIINRIDFDLNRWTLADFCELIWTIKTRYPKNVTIKNEIMDRVSFGKPLTERQVVIRIDEIREWEDDLEEFSLGQALALFLYDMSDTQDARSEKVREIGFAEAKAKMRKRTQFLENLSNCNSTPFIIFYGGDDE